MNVTLTIASCDLVSRIAHISTRLFFYSFLFSFLDLEKVEHRGLRPFHVQESI
jgi:hypothetical protein